MAARPLDGRKSWFRTLAETTATAIFVHGERFLYVNPACAELTGYSREELLGLGLLDLVHPESHDELRERLEAEASTADDSGRLELRLVRKSGEERWVDSTLGRIDYEGRSAFAGTAFDITDRKVAELALRESEKRLNLAQRAARSVTWEWLPDSDRLSVNPYADQLFGFRVHGVIRTGEDFLAYVHPDDRERLDRALVRTLSTGEDLSVEIRILSPRGEVRWVAEKALAVRDENGWTRKVIGVAHDISERKIAEEALFQEKERAHVTLASIADGVIRTDARGVIDYLNPVAQKLTGWTLAESYGRPAREVYCAVDGETRKRLIDPVEQCLKDRRETLFLGERLLVRRDGVEIPVHDSAAPVRNRDGALIGAVLVFKDLSRIREVEAEMLHLTNHDPLTGLINRRGFAKAVTEAIDEARTEESRHALCYIDLDQFKLINDTSGHAAGDQLIRQLASMIRTKLRESDMLARLGGDEFGILLRDRSLEEAQELADEVGRAIRELRFLWKERIFSIGASIGLVPISAESGDFAELLSAADAACYVAKESGGDRIHPYRPGDSAVAERYGEMQWISRIQEALDQGRFCLYQQGIFPLAGSSGEAPLQELLIRLIDTDGTLVSPGSFIPAAERYGLISAVDRWVLTEAIRLVAERQELDPADESCFTINISGQSLGAQGFLETAIEQFESTGSDPRRILFEITETAAIGDLPNAMRFFSVLRAMGCRFVLDDFGKGLSSLGYLKNLPLDYLKIDGEFVRNMASDPVQAALVTSIHEIGDVMGFRTIAESVEDLDTLEALRRIGVDYAQGFLLARPQPLTSPGAGSSD